MSMARSTAAIASLPQTSFCSGLATGASARTPETFSLAFMAAIRAGERRSYQVSNGPSEERICVLGQCISAPRDVVIGADQREVPRVHVAGFFARQIENRKRHAPAPCRLFERARVDVRLETQEREVAAEAVEDRYAFGEPHVRRPRSGRSAGRVAVPVVGRGRAVRDDDRGPRVENAEMNAGNIEFGRGVADEPLAERGASRVPGVPVLLDLSGKLDLADRFRHGPRKARIAMCDRLALGLVGREQSGSAPALAGRGELPAEVGGVVDRGVVALAAGRGEKMGRVARDENATVSEAFGDQGE